MFVPLMAAWMEQNLDEARQWVDPTQIGTLAKVAAVAREREIAGVVRPTVLAGNYMFDVMRKLTVRLVKAAVLTAFSGPFTDEPPGYGIHHY